MACQSDNYPYAQYNNANMAGAQQMSQPPMQTQTYMKNMQGQQMSQPPMQSQMYTRNMQGQQMSQPPMQPQTYTRNMQTPPLSPLAGSLPSLPSGISITSPSVPLSTLAGTIPGTVPGTGRPITPLTSSMPAAQPGIETPTTVQSPYYTAGFLKNFIGKNVRVEFVLGTTGTTSDRVGTLLEVGASYIVIQPLLTDDLLMCDLYSIRFVTIFG